MKEIWDERFSGTDYMYGTEPNPQFKLFIDNLSKGSLLLPGEGEGRNAVFAARMGHTVTAVDQSEQGKIKAMALAHQHGIEFDYLTIDLLDSQLTLYPYDAVALVFLHLPPGFRAIFHQHLHRLIKPNGHLFIVGFSTEQLDYHSGGPKTLDWLYTPELLANDFNNYQIVQNEKITTHLSEGQGHQGEASLVIFEAVKPF